MAWASSAASDVASFAACPWSGRRLFGSCPSPGVGQVRTALHHVGPAIHGTSATSYPYVAEFKPQTKKNRRSRNTTGPGRSPFLIFFRLGRAIVIFATRTALPPCVLSQERTRPAPLKVPIIATTTARKPLKHKGLLRTRSKSLIAAS